MSGIHGSRLMPSRAIRDSSVVGLSPRTSAAPCGPLTRQPVRKAMAAYDWPGNVRELRNTIESMVVQDQDGLLDLDDLQDADNLRRLLPAEAQAAGPGNLAGRPLNEVERYYIEQALELTDGNREEAAHLLGIGERTIYRMLVDWKLQDDIRRVMSETGNDLSEVAQQLGLKKETLQRKLKKWGLTPATS